MTINLSYWGAHGWSKKVYPDWECCSVSSLYGVDQISTLTDTLHGLRQSTEAQQQRPTVYIDSRIFYTAFLSITDLSSFKWISYWKVVSLRSTSLHMFLLPILYTCLQALVVIYIKKKNVISSILHYLFKQICVIKKIYLLINLLYVLHCTLIS